MERLLIYLTAIAGLAKDIHYQSRGENFYSIHLLMDRIYDGLYDFVDEIKENYYMYLDMPVPDSYFVWEKSAGLVFEKIKEYSLKETALLNLMKDCIYIADEESKKNSYDCGDNDLFGRISSKLKNGVALLNKTLE